MDIKQELKTIFSNINDLLKFAETKNAGIIAFNLALIIGLLSAYSDLKNKFNEICFLFCLIFLFISIIVSILSQFPQTDNEVILHNEIKNPNIYFYGHLANLKHNELVVELEKRNADYKIDAFDNDLINQILKNSRITLYKFTFFKTSVHLTLVGLVTLFFSFFLKLLCP